MTNLSIFSPFRALSRPPLAVKTVLEAVTTMLGSDKPEWIDVRKAISKQDFIATVVHFDTNSLDARTIRAVEVRVTFKILPNKAFKIQFNKNVRT